MSSSFLIPLGLLAFATLVAFYFMIGYPLLLAWVDWPQAEPVRKDPQYRTSVTVLLAVHNGDAFLRAKLESLLGLNYPPELVQILVISDGSTDGTNDIAREFASRRVTLIEAPRGGKSAALNLGMQEARGEILFFTDVRQPLDPNALGHLVANFADPAVGAVSGELKYYEVAAGEQADMNLYWRYEIWARNRHSQIDSLFNTTGCIYALRRSLAGPIPADTLTDDAVLPLRAFFKGYRVIMDPQAIAYDYPSVAGTEFRRRMRTLAGLWQVHWRMPQLLGSAHRMRFHFLSHKTGRLIVPWALVTAGVATWIMPYSLTRTFLLDGEIALFVLAAIDRFIPRGLFLKRLTSPAKTFLVMNGAAMMSIMVFLVSPQSLWGKTQVERRG